MAALVATRSSEDSVLLSHFHEHDTAAGVSGGGAGSGGGGAGGCPAGPRGRSRKGKPGPKKQPQRGLGVAQLEKLRLQEQSKQEAACLGLFMPLTGAGVGYGMAPNQSNVAPLCLPAHLLSRPALKCPTPHSTTMAAAALLVPAWANKEHCTVDPSAAVLMSRQHQQQSQQQSVAPMCKPRSYDGLAAHPPPRGPPMNLFDSSHPPGPIQLKRELSLLGVPTVPAELSSFQTKHPAGNGNGNRPGPVWSNASVASQQKLQHGLSPRLVMVSETHPAASSSNQASTTTDNSLKAAAAHYTPRCISTALGSKQPLAFLKTTPSRANDELVKPRKVILELDNRMACCIADPDNLSMASSKKRGPCASSYVDESLAPTAKRSSSNSNSSGGGGGGGGGCGGDFLTLSLYITSSANNECTSLSSGDSHPLHKPLSMEETGTELEECNARSPSYGSSTTVDLPANKCTEIDLSLKL